MRPQLVFVRRGSAAHEAAAADGRLADVAVYVVTDRVAAKISTLEAPPDVLAVFPLPAAPPLYGLAGPGGGAASTPGAEATRGTGPAGAAAGALVVYADRVADPGNMGTLVRAAAAFGAAALAASPGSVDLYAPKVVRAGMGAAFALPLYPEIALDELVARTGIADVYGLVAHDGDDLATAELSRPAVLCVGAERAGLSPETLGARHAPAHHRAGARGRRRGREPQRRRRRRRRPLRSLTAPPARRPRRRHPAPPIRRPRRQHPAPAGARERMTMDDEQLQILKERAPALAALYTTGRAAILEARDMLTLEKVRVAVLGRKSPLTEVLRSISTARARGPAAARQGRQHGAPVLESLVEEREAELKKAALSASLDTSASTSPCPASPSRPVTCTSSARRCARSRTSSSASATASPRAPRSSSTTTTSPRSTRRPATRRARLTTPSTCRAARDHARGGRRRRPRRPAAHAHLAVQVRVMEAQPPPIYVHLPGQGLPARLRRHPHADVPPGRGARRRRGHHARRPQGHAAGLRRAIFGDDRDVRLRPHFFPFTEPSVEVDVSCELLRRRGLPPLQGLGLARDPRAPAWSTPTSSGSSATTPRGCSGFAFGMGIERIAMLKHGIPDLRLFFDNDVRFLGQF